MRILYDGTIYIFQPTGGISRYFSNIISRLPHDFTPVMTIPVSGDVALPTHPKMRVYHYREFSFRPGRIAKRLNKYYVRSIPVPQCPSIIHPTYYYLLNRHDLSTYSQPIVITVWDMVHELFPDLMDPQGRNAYHKRRALAAAQRIMCISENTKKDLLQFYSLSEDKVFVTPLATDMNESMSHGDEVVPERPYVLYVGGRWAYKNFDGLLKAFSKVSSAQPDTSLVVVGPSFDEDEERMILDLKIGNRIEHYGIVSDRHLAKLYRCSMAFVYPSLYEGFGIPILEAMACGTPVVASNRSSFPEVVGDAGLLFDPEAKNDLPDILLSLLKNPSERNCLVAKGYERVKIFNWDKTAVKTVDVYNSVAQV